MKNFLLLFLFTSLGSNLIAQDPLRFKDEVNELTANDSSIDKQNLVLFTGSSSIRMWKDVGNYFPKKNVLNRGFGGSTTADLIYYFEQLILPYSPQQLFIYEGDNDLAMGKSPEEVLKDINQLLQLIRERLPAGTQVIIISPKPSIARWEMRSQYEALNLQLKSLAKGSKHVEFADVWTPMLLPDGSLRQDLFIEDGLHMNKKGYDIWGRVLKDYLR